MTMQQLKDVFKEILPTLPEIAQEKLQTSFPLMIQMPEISKPDFPGTAANAPPDGPED